jgi:hypothetical protein
MSKKKKIADRAYIYIYECSPLGREIYDAAIDKEFS